MSDLAALAAQHTSSLLNPFGALGATSNVGGVGAPYEVGGSTSAQAAAAMAALASAANTGQASHMLAASIFGASRLKSGSPSMLFAAGGAHPLLTSTAGYSPITSGPGSASASGSSGSGSSALASLLGAAGSSYGDQHANRQAGSAPGAGGGGGGGNSWCLFVYNLAPEIEENVIWKLFGPFGAVQQVNLVKDVQTNKCKGFAFVTMSDYNQALMAIRSLNGSTLANRVLQVSFKTTGSSKARKTIAG